MKQPNRFHLFVSFSLSLFFFTSVHAQSPNEFLEAWRASQSQSEVEAKVLAFVGQSSFIEPVPEIPNDVDFVLSEYLTFGPLAAYREMPTQYVQEDTWILNAVVKVLVEHRYGSSRETKLRTRHLETIKFVFHRILLDKAITEEMDADLLTYLLIDLGWMSDFENAYKGDGNGWVLNSISFREKIRRTWVYRTTAILTKSAVAGAVVGGLTYGFIDPSQIGVGLALGAATGACAVPIVKLGALMSDLITERRLSRRSFQ